MRVLTLPDRDAVAAAAADLLAAAVAARGELSLGLPTGRTAIPLYDELARRHQRAEVDLSQVMGFNLDELVLPGAHPASFRTFMARHAWTRTGLDPGRCDIPDGAADPEAECRRYEQVLAAAGGLDFTLLGVGEDGHVAYNLPGPPHETTHVVTLPEALADELGVEAEHRPLRAITMGLGTLLDSRRLVLMATGEVKRHAVATLLAGPETPDWPCSFLRSHRHFVVLLDSAAAGKDAP